MKTPKFWQEKSLIAHFLLPLSFFYQIGYLFKIILQITLYQNKKQKIKTICIANLTLGGAGKTPVTLKVGNLLKKKGIKFSYLSKGYGGEIKNLTKLNHKHTATDVGDEALLLKGCSDSFICHKITSKILEQKEFSKNEFLIIDDGFQNFSWKKDLSILVVDGYYAFGNELTFPAGPLREFIAIGVKRADIIIIINEDRKNIKKRFCKGKKLINAKLKIINGEDFIDKDVLAFAGIGHPDKFFKSLKNSGANIKKKFSFADHYQYSQNDLQRLTKLAKKHNLELVTTKKDWIRMDKKYQDKIKFLDIEVELEGELEFSDFLSTL